MRLQQIAGWFLAVRAWLRRHLRAHVTVAVLVFLVTFTASLYYVSSIRANVHKDVSTAYQRQVRIAVTAMTSRLQQYETLLRGGAGLFTVADIVTQDGWTSYFQPYEVPNHYPEVEGIGFSRYLPADQVPAYLDMLQAQGRSNPQIFPAGDRPVYVPVTYNAMYSGNNGKSLGYDGYVNPTRRAAMDQAADSGAPVMSGTIELVSQRSPNRSAFIIYLPVYKRDAAPSTPSERRTALYGFVYIAVDMPSMFGGITKDNQASHFGMQLFDESSKSARPAYASPDFQKLARQPGAATSSATLQLYGHTWRAAYAGTPELISSSERYLPLQALWRALLSSLLFAGAVWYILARRERRFTQLKQLEVQTAKDDLLSLASHQLRTPATVVKQYVGMLLQGYGGEVTDQQTGMLQHAYDSNERQLEIINQLLYVARLDAGRITLRRKQTDITALIREVIDDQRSAIMSRRQQVTFRHSRPLLAEVDPHYFRMVLENLLSNAAKYTSEGGSIHIALRKSKRTFIVAVSDTGVGITAEHLATVFEKFTRVENELSTDVNGSGVGLYLTKQVVELHGGAIEVTSEPGKGSTFTVRMPLHKPTAFAEVEITP